MTKKKADILGVKIDLVNMNDALRIVEGFLWSSAPHFIATANAEMVMMANRDAELKKILNGAHLVVPDGAGVVWAARHLGFSMPERVAGFDLVQRILAERREGRKLRVYFFGSAPGVAQKAKQSAEERCQDIEVVGVHDGYFSSAEEKEIIKEIQRLKPQLLLVALGVPKQEKWIRKNLKILNVPVVIGVGGTLDVMAGVMKRAPLWMQKAKLEWLFRGLLQPKRIGRLMELPKFVLRVRMNKKH